MSGNSELSCVPGTFGADSEQADVTGLWLRGLRVQSPSLTQTSRKTADDSEWTRDLGASERRDLKVACRGFLRGMVSREEMRATIAGARLMGLIRAAAAGARP